jgi:hypothetical protein
VRKLENFKKHADGELADAGKVLAAARTDAAKAAAENVKQKATAKIEELSTQLDAAMADERSTQNAVAAAEAIAKTTDQVARRFRHRVGGGSADAERSQSVIVGAPRSERKDRNCGPIGIHAGRRTPSMNFCARRGHIMRWS